MVIGIILLALIAVVIYFFWNDAVSDKYDITISEDKIPVFSLVELGFVHQYNGDKSLPIAPSALIDIDNDNVDEVFFGGGMNQEDAIFAYRNNKFVNISSEVNLPKKGTETTSTGVVSADFDNNGFTDLLLGREDGLRIYYNFDGKFIEKIIDTPMNEKSIPAGLTVGDIDKDGDLDIFMSTYLKKNLMEGQTIFEDKTYGSTSELLLNDGHENFTSITKQAGLEYVHNTFMAVFVDIDNDTNIDLVVAHDTGEVRTYKNNGNLTFTMKENPTTNKFAYPMGIAVGDYNNDGLVDFMFSNTGSTLPRALAKGDIKDASKFNEKWILFRNDGNFKFTDVAAETKIADYEFSWGCTFADMNNDGLQDLMVAENYVDLAPNKIFRLKSRFLVQKEDGTFAPTEEKSGVVNPHFGITALVSDFNKDGYLDMIWTNIDSPSLAYINKGGVNNFIQIDLEDAAKDQGAKVTITTATKTLTEWLVTGEGLASDQTALLHFGLGQDTEVKRVLVQYLNGKTDEVINPKINTILNIKSEREKLKIKDSINLN
ncbi:VCBS repeat protein [Mariniflexile fucanivorans]|uniref:VCBS repeat protein n=1 Tax=Mariniflexile fucanivorans TaxID=264023 RepID=A0A4R1RAJ3_9FLAO|nr:CRTAC1 family protein [Mariniflexile fucanivorans]TCL62620.1 VCBS repeat protein [Mariniflexile fucanivorans]